MCNVQPFYLPNARLKKTLAFVKIIIIIHLCSSFLRLFINVSDIFFDLFAVFLLYLATMSIFYSYMTIYILLCLINEVSLFLNFAMIIQMILQKTLDQKQVSYLQLGIMIYLFIFYLFTIIFNFSVYKEMKAQYIEHIGGDNPGLNAPQQQNNQAQYQNVPDQERPQPANNNASSGRFQAFSGRGLAVGGNS
jgi:hypothetical protein